MTIETVGRPAGARRLRLPFTLDPSADGLGADDGAYYVMKHITWQEWTRMYPPGEWTCLSIRPRGRPGGYIAENKHYLISLCGRGLGRFWITAKEETDEPAQTPSHGRIVGHEQ